jgi:hypothetical protein
MKESLISSVSRGISFIRRNLCQRKRVHFETQLISTPIICCVAEPLNIPIISVNTVKKVHFTNPLIQEKNLANYDEMERDIPSFFFCGLSC